MSPPSVSDALTPDPALVERFRRDCEAIAGAPATPERRLGLAVSGGPDSVALLLLAAAAYPRAVAAATVDHGVRPSSRAEAEQAASVCRALDVPHDILAVPPNVLLTGNLQDRARTARYRLLAGWARARDEPGDVGWVATAHQRDDVAETFLMRARRGAGVGGLAAMARVRPLSAGLSDTPLIRPLLAWSRAELAGIVAEAGLIPAADPSNADPRFDRARLRALLAGAPDLPAARLARSARNLRDAEEALAWAAERAWTERCEIEAHGSVWVDSATLPHEIRRRLARRAIDVIRLTFGLEPEWRGAGLERLAQLLESGRAATLAGVRARPGARWRFDLAPPRRAGRSTQSPASPPSVPLPLTSACLSCVEERSRPR